MTRPTRSMIAADLSPQARVRATEFLAGLDVDWAKHIEAVGPCQLQTVTAREPYEALVRAVASQQLHAKASQAILGRLLSLYPNTAFPSAQQLLDIDPDVQRDCGFSMTKVAAIRGIAQAAVEGVVPTLEQALRLNNEELVERLITLKGVGRWTVEMFLITTLERSDILPVGDFGVREGYRRLKALDKAPTPKQLQEIGQVWSPYRTVATWYLWQRP